jgi:peptidoglycan/LPS O-acetylase OafA/YrhL
LTSFYRKDIDGLRAVAVSAVVIYHTQLTLWGREVLPGGYLGVDVFFVISGYLISMIMLRQHAAQQFSVIDFFVRRIRRIAPILLVVLSATLVMGWFTMMPEPFSELASTTLAALGFSSNFWFWLEDSYTAAPSQFKLLLHTWSLAVEEQFYLILPFAFPWLLRRGQSVTVWAIAATAAASLALAQYSTADARDFAFFLPLTRIWELLIGTLVAILVFHNRLPDLKWMRKSCQTIGLLVLLAAFLYFDETTRHPSLLTVIPIAATSVIIAYGHGHETTFSPLTWRPMVYLGLISYSLYLWHWPIFVFTRGLQMGHLIGYSVALAIALSVLSYHFIEKPFRRNYSGLVFSSAVCAGLGIVVTASIFVISMGGVPSRLPFDVSDRKRDNLEWNGLACHMRDECIVNWDEDRPKFILVGDSHAGAISGALGRAIIEKGYGYAQFTSSACLHIEGVTNPARNMAFNEDCTRRAVKLQNFLSASRPATIIHFGYYSYWLTNYRLRNYEGEFDAPALQPVPPFKTTQLALQAGYNSWIAKGHRILFIAPVPELMFNPFAPFSAASFAPNLSRPRTPVALYDVFTRPYYDMLAQLSPMNKFEIFSPRAAFCNDEMCQYEDDTGVFYTDYDHLSGKGARVLTDALLSQSSIGIPH